MVFLRPVEPCFVARVATKISSCRVIVVCRQPVRSGHGAPNPQRSFRHFLKGISAQKRGIFITSRAIISGFKMITAVRLY